MKAPIKGRRAPAPLDEERLRELALRYVGKYATTRSKLRTYLSRKLRERGWNGACEADIEKLAKRFAELGYIDDAAYAMTKSRALSAGGYGKRRLTDKLRVDGIALEDRAPAVAHAEAQAVEAALRFAERRRLGPFAHAAADPAQLQKWIAAMVRAGHGFGLARAIAILAPGAPFDRDALADFFGRTED